MAKTEPRYPIKTLTTSISILEVLVQRNSAASLSEISDQLGSYPSAVHRILDTLKYWGYVEQDPNTHKYQLGVKLIELGLAKLRRMNWLKETEPYLKELVEQCKETVHLGVLVEGEVLYLKKHESSHHAVRMTSQVGKKGLAHSTALGKVLLAYLKEDKRKEILKNKELRSLTDHTITDKVKLEEELHKVRKRGFSVDRGENEEYVHCIGAPIRNYQGEVIAAISISGPAYRLEDKIEKGLDKTIINTTKEISRKLGYCLRDNEFLTTRSAKVHF